MSVVYRTKMKIQPKITIITLGLSLASLGLNSVQAQESLPCYMINSSGEIVNLIDMCQERSVLTEADKNTETPSPDSQTTTNDTETSPVVQPGETEGGKPVTDESTYRDNEQLRFNNNGESTYRDNEQLRFDNPKDSEMNNP